MKRRDVRLHNGEGGSALAIRLIRSRGKNQVSKVLNDGTVEVKLALRGSNHNEELKNFLSKILDIPKERINVIAGKKKSEKLVSIIDVEPQKVQKEILKNIS